MSVEVWTLWSSFYFWADSFIGSLCILLNCSLITPHSIGFVHDRAVCGRRSRAKLLIEAEPVRGVLQIVGLRNMWACVVCLARNLCPVVWLSPSCPLNVVTRRHSKEIWTIWSFNLLKVTWDYNKNVKNCLKLQHLKNVLHTLSFLSNYRKKKALFLSGLVFNFCVEMSKLWLSF